MAFLRASLSTPDYGRNGVVTVSTTETGTNASTDVLSTADAKAWMKVDTSTDDSLIADLVAEVIDITEQTYSFQLIEKSVVAEFESFGKRVGLQLFPIQSITSVKTVDDDGTEITLTSGSDYYLTGDTLVMNQIYDSEYPFARIRLKVTYVAGYTSIPNGIIIGLKKAVLSSYEDRQDLVDGSVNELPNGSKQHFKRYSKLG
jgi:uncharacterized phiE125 gp8 family phage protein